MENRKILIVEDEEIIRLGLKDNFELENYTVETAEMAKRLSKRRTRFCRIWSSWI